MVAGGLNAGPAASTLQGEPGQGQGPWVHVSAELCLPSVSSHAVRLGEIQDTHTHTNAYLKIKLLK